ncbi:MAG: DNA translocase FtsK [Rhodothermales bacterium]
MSPERKQEVLGIILMAIGLLVALAVLTYNAADDGVARRFSLDLILRPGDDVVNNALGLTGAWLARLLVPSFLGYPVLLLSGLIGAWGYVLLRHGAPAFMRLVTVLVMLATYMLAVLFGWVSLRLETDLLHWSGLWGLGTAGWLERIAGATGSIILIVLLLLVTALLLVDRDIQATIDRIENTFRRLFRALEDWWFGRKARKEARRDRQEALLEQKRKEVEAARRNDARQRETTRMEQQAAARREELQRQRQPEPVPDQRPPAVLPERRPEPDPAREDGELEIRVHEQKVEEKARTRRPGSRTGDYAFEMPPVDLLDAAEVGGRRVDYDELEENKQILLDKLATYNIEIIGIDAVVGPTVTLYELTPAPGVKISRITALENDLAMALAARGIRMIAPIPGKSAIGVEIPNRHRELVLIRDVVETKTFSETKMELPLILGKSIEGEVVLQDLTKLPHVLMAGATGSGKSVGVNTFIAGLLYSVPPSLLKFVMIDPKKIELSVYTNITSHYVAMPPEADDAIITDFHQALGTLKSCEREMELRYDLLKDAQVRSIKEYNERFRTGNLDEDAGHKLLPYIVVVVDELADLMMTAGKDIEAPIARLAQMARAVGIHLILATQRPSVDVITGLIKANFPARIAYQVASKVDSRTILDQNGAEGLVGNGDLLYMLGSRVMRLQGPFISLGEIDRVTGHIVDQEGPGPYMLPSIEESTSDQGPGMSSMSGGDRDELFDEAAHIIVRAQQGSVSLLQRKLSVGYSRAARIVDQLEDAGIVGPFEGSKARQVYVDDEMALDNLLRGNTE